MAETIASKESGSNVRSLTSQFLFIALVLGVPFGIATTPAVFRDGDTSWQVAAGEWILRHGRIPTTDPFSFTAAGHPWVAMEWLSEVLLAIAYMISGFAGLAALVAAAFIGLHAILFFHLERRVPVGFVATTLVMMDFVLAPFVLARPHVLAWVLLAAWTALLLSAAEKGRPPPLWSTLILVMWTNLHASFPLAIVIAGAVALDALIAVRFANIRQWAIFGFTSVVAVCLNANGLAGLLQPFRTSTLAMLPLIGEWHRSSLDATPFFFAVLAITIVALAWTRPRLPLGRALLLLILLALALLHVRHQSSFVIVAACVIPPLLRPLGQAPQALVPRWLLLFAVPMLAFRAIVPLVLPDSEANPRQLIAAIRPALRNEPVFNAYIFGGPLILEGIRPYIDGRAEIYGDEFVADYVNITNGDLDAFNRAVQRYDIRWTIIPKSKQRLIKAIESSGAWHRVHSDSVGIIDVRVPARNPARS